MDHYSILDHNSSSPAGAGIAVGSALLGENSETGPGFHGEDSGRSLAEMAQADLDATLQLLAERAQYITGASGAAIALRRGEHNDMLCRASVGASAPELGALFSMEYGLSGESVRTRSLLRCDDTERDPRVNHEVCSQLGIASVVVMPVVSEQGVLGVFELLSGKPRAFAERDLSALLRLSEMVENAVKHAAAEQTLPAPVVIAESRPRVTGISSTASAPESIRATEEGPAPALPFEPVVPAKQEPTVPVLKKALFWSAPFAAQAGGQAKAKVETVAVPPVLRNLQKCQACGFPVSQGRIFCVECEEKQWRGQPLPQAGEGPQDFTSQRTQAVAAEEIVAPQVAIAAASDMPASVPTDASTGVPGSDNGGPFFSSALPSESWFASNKYILGALLVVAAVIGAIVWLR